MKASHLFLCLLSALASSQGNEVLLHKERHGRRLLTWPDAVVPWELAESEFSRLQEARVERALRRLEMGTCLRFPRRTGQAAYIKLRNVPHRCTSSVGHRTDQPVEVWVGWPGCQKNGNIQHEVLHALGMRHEHTRPDRDQHVTVLWENIIKGKEKNFEISPANNTNLLPYDYGSVLHYRAQAFSRNEKITLMPVKASALSIMGQRKGVSKGDLAKLNLLYNCPAITPSRKLQYPSKKKDHTNFLSSFWNFGKIKKPFTNKGKLKN